MWRYDAGRSASTADELPEELHLQWVRHLGEPAPAWPEEQYKLQFDRSYEPIVMGKRIFVPSMVADKVTAYDTDTGEELWRFYCDGPVRFAPVGWKDRIYFVSDDGCLYCVAAADGKLIRKLRLGPSDIKILGNGRLISAWPARGAPVLFKGKIYCAASIWPFMGVFIYAIDAETGEIAWENSGSGSRYMTHQHNSAAFGGVAPQGYLAATQERLLIPSRTTPACYDRRTGEMVYYRMADRGKGKHVGGYDVQIRGDFFFNSGVMYRLRDGEGIVATNVQVAAEDSVMALDKDGKLVGYVPEEIPKAKRKKGDPEVKGKGLWEGDLNGEISKVHIKAGSRLYGSNSKGNVAGIDIPEKGGKAEVSWNCRIEGKVWNMLAGDEKLFVVTEEGLLYCFGGKEGKTKRHGEPDCETLGASKRHRRKVKQLFSGAGAKEGYCVLLGIGDGKLLRAILAESEFQVIAFEQDSGIVESMRRELDEANLYGRRVSILAGDITSLQLPPYLADLIVAADVEKAGFERPGLFIEKVYHSLRPYGGTAWFGVGRKKRATIAKCISDCDLAGGEVETKGRGMLLRRTGPLPGSGDWIGQYADAANTVVSKDRLKGPLGLLWFGDESQFRDVLPRHSHGPPEQVVGGRLFIEGVDSISARDVYTGRALWKTTLKNPNIYGVYFDGSYKPDYRDLSYNQLHIPGASVRGVNFVASEDKVYVIDGAKCRVLDAGTGKDIDTFSLPARDDEAHGNWAYIGVYGEYLLGGADFAKYLDLFAGNNKKLHNWAKYFNKNASKRLVVMNRHTGKVLWSVDANVGFVHNGIAAGGGRIFCLDALPPYIRSEMNKRKIKIKSSERLLAFDVRDGAVVWERDEDVFGSWLGYSEEHDILLQGYRKSRDMVPEPGDRMATHRGKTGKVVWDKAIKYDGPCMLHGETIITQRTAYNLLTGEQVMREHPLTGEPVKWGFSRNYGCNTAVASANLITFRSAAAGYFDLAGDGGTGNFGGFKSGCTINLIAANGVLNAPEYTRTCTCSYQNQTSLAMVHMPEVETWTFNPIGSGGGDIRRLGLNFGAPGDRKAENGTLWLDYPSNGGASPGVSVKIEPEKPKWFSRHSSRIQKGVLRWVEASGAKGVRDIRVKMVSSKGKKNDAEKRYTVRLHFAEPERIEAGKRVFDIVVEGETIFEDFDIVKETGGANIGVVKEFTALSSSGNVDISLKPKANSLETVVCGIEIVAR